MNIRRFFDRIQLNLHLLGFHTAATWFGKFGTPALQAEFNIHDRPTIPIPIVEFPEGSSGPGWSLEEANDFGPLKVVEFDPTFNKNVGIDVTTDIAIAIHKHEVN